MDQLVIELGDVRSGRSLPDTQHMLDALEHLVVLLNGQIRFRAGGLRVQPRGGVRIVAELFRALEHAVLSADHLYLRGEIAELRGGRDGAHVLQSRRSARLQCRVDHRSALGEAHVDGAVFASGIDAGEPVTDVRVLGQCVLRPSADRVLRSGELCLRRFQRNGAILVDERVWDVAVRAVEISVRSLCQALVPLQHGKVLPRLSKTLLLLRRQRATVGRIFFVRVWHDVSLLFIIISSIYFVFKASLLSAAPA